MSKYAVAVGQKVFIIDTNNESMLQVINYPEAKFKKFQRFEDAEAFIKEHSKGIGYTNNIDPMFQVSKENVCKHELINVGKISPKDYVTLMTRIHNIEEKLKKIEAETNTKLENLIAHANSYKVKNMDTLNEPPSKKIKIDCAIERFVTINKDFVVVYTDGACSKNGKMGAKAGIGIWFNDDHPLNISAPLQGPATNNNAEIQAARVAITQASFVGIQKLTINTDSKFLINCMTQFIHRWKKNNWQLTTGDSVKNKEELIKLDKAIQLVQCVEWVYVAAHKGNHGNEMADRLAKAGAEKYKTNVTYSIHADDYNVKYVKCDK